MLKMMNFVRLNALVVYNSVSVAHSPYSCLLRELWTRKSHDESETVNWITVYTKPCPKCHKSVEKDSSCNLVSCICWQAFCKYKNVLQRSLGNKERTRMSWAVFVEPPHEAMIELIPELFDGKKTLSNIQPKHLETEDKIKGLDVEEQVKENEEMKKEEFGMYQWTRTSNSL
ncbi:hypothetical protein RHSIM_Rhsim06G0105700 [Rhododendron simsii]|uniref:RBR-type E3 ubiquitin transferase n=1 Tax=Rhododendron simsii TaxID=118357 RepID=A0A834GSV8_RHOSS|nr:hypothetical protein RHSIM_Rhsim06G0105700 [Rhododendron simsii]